jgi:hypothetical protein
VRFGPADEGAYDYQSAEALTSQFGQDLFSSNDNDTAAFRETLMNYVLAGGPGWPSLLPAGRRVVERSLTPNMRQCFEIANLLVSTAADVVSWWDSCATAVRRQQRDAAGNDGREAERLSWQRECEFLAGTQLEPIWVALEDNGFGCDIQTFRPGSSGWGNARPFFIEVKSTVGQHRFYISRNEWDFARRHSDSWELQFWNLRSNHVQSLRAEVIDSHIPKDNGSGEWVSAMILVEELDD